MESTPSLIINVEVEYNNNKECEINGKGDHESNSEGHRGVTLARLS